MVMSREIDGMTYNLYVDCGLSSFETARQSGVTQQTVRSRVRRHVPTAVLPAMWPARVCEPHPTCEDPMTTQEMADLDREIEAARWRKYQTNQTCQEREGCSNTATEAYVGRFILLVCAPCVPKVKTYLQQRYS